LGVEAFDRGFSRKQRIGLGQHPVEDEDAEPGIGTGGGEAIGQKTDEGMGKLGNGIIGLRGVSLGEAKA